MSFSNFFSSRSWNGLLPAAASFASCAIIFDLLAWLAWHGDQYRVFDVTALLIGFPSVLLVMLFAAALAWSFVGRLPFLQTLGWALRLLPLAWIVPLIDFVRLTGAGTPSIIPYLNGWGIVKAMITGGIFPLDSGIPMGIRAGLIASAFAVGMVAWHVSKKIVTSILAGIWFSIISVVSISSVSMAIFWNAPWSNMSWKALPVEMLRRSSTIFGKGYWWNAMYDRFPTAIDNQIDIASRLFSAVGAFSIIVLFLVLLFLVNKSNRRLLKYIYGTWGALLFASSLLVGCIFGYNNASLNTSVSFIPAYLFIIYLILVSRLSSVMRRDLANLEQDERLGKHQPILDGQISIDHAKLIAFSAEASGMATAYLLGWPVLLMTIVYFACARLSRDRMWSVVSQISTMFRAIGSSALAGMVFLFMTQDIRLSTSLLVAMGVAAAIRLLIEWFWIPKFQGTADGGRGTEAF